LPDEQHKDGQNVRQVIGWLKHKPYADRPFFIACGIQKPHVPFLAPDKYFARIPRSSLTYQLDPTDDWGDIPQQAMVKRFTAFGFELGRENAKLRREYMQAYHACIEFVDTQLGLLIDEIKTQGLWEDTVIVFTSDHGYHLGEHFLWGKVSLFEVCARVPLMIRIPGRGRQGVVSQSLAELVDVWPTLIDACGLKPPEHLQGTSLLPVVEDPRVRVRDTSYTVVTRRANGRATLGRAIRSARLRYAEWPDGEELYDLEQDPAEHRNLSNVANYQGQLVRMRTLLAQAKRTAAEQAIAQPGDPTQQR
jgi:iduronate 2-sulfatase